MNTKVDHHYYTTRDPESGPSSPISQTIPRSPGFDDISIPRPERPRMSYRDSTFGTTVDTTVDTNLVNVNRSNGTISNLPHQQNEQLQMTARNPPKNLYRIIAICVWQVTGGFSDATPGALLPFIEADYGLSYSEVSTIWMANACGFILVACLAHKIQDWFGKQKSLIFGTLCSVVMYSIVLSGCPFPLVVVGFFFGGIGLATVLAQGNVFLARMDKLSKYLSFYHGSYGAGATVAPLLATLLVSSGAPWHYFYLLLLGMMISNGVFFWFAFNGADVDLAPWDVDVDEGTGTGTSTPGAGPRTSGPTTSGSRPYTPNESPRSSIELQDFNSIDSQPNPQTDSTMSDLRLALKTPITWIVAVFVLFYQGSEVSLAGWIVTYLLDYRGGGVDVGYVAAGFWGGLTLGRVVLTRPLHKHFGARRSVIVVSLLSILFVICTWVVPTVIGAGICVAIAGVCVGPNYPLMISLVANLLPRKIQVISLTIVTAFGSSGGALFPFLIGVISQSAGAYVVLPAFISMYSAMLILWICLPNRERQERQGGNLTLWQKFW